MVLIVLKLLKFSDIQPILNFQILGLFFLILWNYHTCMQCIFVHIYPSLLPPQMPSQIYPPSHLPPYIMSSFITSLIFIFFWGPLSSISAAHMHINKIIHWDMGRIGSNHTSKEYWLSLPSSHQLPIVSQLGWVLKSPSVLHARTPNLLDLVQEIFCSWSLLPRVPVCGSYIRSIGQHFTTLPPQRTPFLHFYSSFSMMFSEPWGKIMK